jgi:hypothetical protein
VKKLGQDSHPDAEMMGLITEVCFFPAVSAKFIDLFFESQQTAHFQRLKKCDFPSFLRTSSGIGAKTPRSAPT